MQHYLYILLFVLGTLFACKKESLPKLPESNSPIYSVKGTIDGQEIKYEAGVNGMYMETSFNYLNNVLQYNANLKSDINNFDLLISNADIDIPSSTIDFSLITGIELANMNLNELLVLNKNTFNNHEEINTVSWTVDGEDPTSEEIIISEPGFYNICATIVFLNGAEKELCNDLLISYKKNSSFGLRHYLNQSNQLNCFIDVPQDNIQSIAWNINGDQYATTNTISFLLEAEPYLIEATVVLTNGVKRTKRFFIDGAYPKNYIEDFSIQENQSQINHWDLRGRLSVSHFGNEWTPANYEDDIIIYEVLKKGVNEKKQTVYEIKGVYEGVMENKSNQQQADGSFEFTLAFAIP